jgi:glycerol-3-phosphate dehydrogenase (NAD(P)+)
VAEGVSTAREVDLLARERAIDMPITRAVCAVLFEGLAPAAAVEQLLARDPRAER